MLTSAAAVGERVERTVPLVIDADSIGTVTADYWQSAGRLFQEGSEWARSGQFTEAREVWDLAGEQGEAALHAVRALRRGLQTLETTEQGDRLAHDRLSTYPGLDEMYKAGHTNVVAWLRDGASDVAALSFFSWLNQDILDQSRDERVRDAIEQEVAKYSLGMHEGVGQGWVCERALYGLGSKLNNVRFVVADVWSSGLVQRAEAWAVFQSNSMVLPQSHSGDPQREELLRTIRSHVFKHELNHLIFDKELADNSCVLSPWEAEALTEHVALSQCSGGRGVRVVRPSERANLGLPDEGAYVAERTLLAALLNEGAHTIDPRVATQAYTSGRQDSQEFQLYRQQLRDAWTAEGWDDDVCGWLTREMDEFARGQVALDRAAKRPTDVWSVQQRAAEYGQQLLKQRRATQLQAKRTQRLVGLAVTVAKYSELIEVVAA